MTGIMGIMLLPGSRTATGPLYNVTSDQRFGPQSSKLNVSLRIKYQPRPAAVLSSVLPGVLVSVDGTPGLQHCL